MNISKEVDDDSTARQEEIDALRAIYPGGIEIKEDEMVPALDGEWRLHKCPGAIITITPRDNLDLAKSTLLNVRLDVTTPPNYPSSVAPTYRLLDQNEGRNLYYRTIIYVLHLTLT